MPNPADPYGAYAYQQRIIKENKYFVASLQASLGYDGYNPDAPTQTSKSCPENAVDSNNNTVNSIPQSSNGVVASSRPATPRGSNNSTTTYLNTLSGELTSVPRSPRVCARAVGAFSPLKGFRQQKELPSPRVRVLETRVAELEAELKSERKSKERLSSTLNDLEKLLDEKTHNGSISSKQGLSPSTPRRVGAASTSLPTIPSPNSVNRSPRRMPHNLF